MTTPTQVRQPWRTTLRTAIQTALVVIPLLGLIVPQVVQIVLEETGGTMPDGLRTVLLAAAAVCVAAAAIVTRVMAIPAVDQLIRNHMGWLAAEPPTAARSFAGPPPATGPLKASVVCPISGCGRRFELPITADLWGSITFDDTGMIEVTAPYGGPEYEAHSRQHGEDGSWRAHFVQRADALGRVAARYRAPE